jgi:hypothetical protein
MLQISQREDTCVACEPLVNFMSIDLLYYVFLIVPAFEAKTPQTSSANLELPRFKSPF